VATYLDRILDTHRASALADRRSLGDLLDEAGACPPARGFAAAIGARPDGELAVIAEVKRRSPSRGDLMVDLDPAEVATSYADGGASCLSVLTDSEWFGGSADDLRAARAASGLPVLRKDFTIDARDVCDARIMGADAVLLIAAALDDSELGDFSALATELGLDALVEVHDEAELERALAVGAGLVGVNQRDLLTFEVDTARATRVAAAIPPEVRSVAESGIMGPEDAALLAAAGYDAVLVGESVVVSDDRRAAVTALRRAPLGLPDLRAGE
jgi:indole-3-glycerol phosphate synthase